MGAYGYTLKHSQAEQEIDLQFAGHPPQALHGAAQLAIRSLGRVQSVVTSTFKSIVTDAMETSIDDALPSANENRRSPWAARQEGWPRGPRDEEDDIGTATAYEDPGAQGR